MTDDNTINQDNPIPPLKSEPRRRYGLAAAAAAVALLVLGAGVGAGAARFMASREAQPLLPPVAISAMADGSTVAVKGKVVEIFGNKIVIEDATGRALVETGRMGEGGKLVAPAEEIVAQGRFEDGFMRGSVIVHADGRTEIIGPPGGHGRHGPKDWLRP